MVYRQIELNLQELKGENTKLDYQAGWNLSWDLSLCMNNCVSWIFWVYSTVYRFKYLWTKLHIFEEGKDAMESSGKKTKQEFLWHIKVRVNISELSVATIFLITIERE